MIPEVANPLTARMHKGVNTTMDEGQTMIAFHGTQDPDVTDGCAHTVGQNFGQETCFAFKPAHFTRDKDGAPSDVFPTLSADADKGDQDPVIAFAIRGRDGGADVEVSGDVVNSIRAAEGGSSRDYVATEWAVRRLTPRECERLQGFPDDYTLIPFGRGMAADSRRYKALGNTKSVNKVRWLGRRIEMVDTLWSNAER